MMKRVNHFHSELETPLTSMGASFTTHVLTRPKPGVLAYKPHGMAHFFYGVILFLGWSCAILGLYGTVFINVQASVLALGGGAFAYLGSRLKNYFCGRRLLDGQRRQVVLDIDPIFGKKTVRIIEFDDIDLLQLIEKRISTSDSTYTAYELNFVLDHGERINLLAHSDGERLRREMTELANFIGCGIQGETVP